MFSLIEVVDVEARLAEQIKAHLCLYLNNSNVLFEIFFKVKEIAIRQIVEREVHDHAAVVFHAHATLLSEIRRLREGCHCVVAAVIILVQLADNVETHDKLEWQREAQANARAEFAVAAEVESDWVREAVLRRHPFFA